MASPRRHLLHDQERTTAALDGGEGPQRAVFTPRLLKKITDAAVSFNSETLKLVTPQKKGGNPKPIGFYAGSDTALLVGAIMPIIKERCWCYRE